MTTAEELVNCLQLKRHPEGGYYKETYRSEGTISNSCLPDGFQGDRPFSTAIYYLLHQGDFSAFHRIRSDECWHFYAGGTLLIHVIEESGVYQCVRLGAAVAEGEAFQYVVPARAWFAAIPARDASFSLVGCTVAPGFDFLDFEMADRTALLRMYPQHLAVIQQLTRG
jgi:uncharacterized protein